jgi:dolichol-phosphate mannosyltransferase
VKRVLVTGAGGFLGANLAARCLADQHEVHAMVRPNGDRWRLAHLERGVHVVEADLRDPRAVASAVATARPHWVFHTGVYGAYSWQTDQRLMVETNVLGTANLLEACAPTAIEAFVNSGTSSEYGPKDHPPIESERAEPVTRYAATKLCATEYCSFFARAVRLPVTTLRLYSVFGPFEDPARLMPNLIVRGFTGELPPLAAPANAHDFVHIDDVCDAFVRVAQRAPREPGAVYNVGSGVQTTLVGLVEATQALLGVRAVPRWQSMRSREWDTTVWVCNAGRIALEYGWRPRYSLAEGLERFAAWFEANPALLALYQRRQAALPSPSSSTGR